MVGTPPGKRRASSPLQGALSPKGNFMKRQSTSRGFTLVEMLIVITIISILASLITAAAVVARRRARVAAIGIEVNQLDMALKAYKEKYGDYPPDFAGVAFTHANATVQAAVRQGAQNAIIRHLARAFPRYQPGVTTAGALNGFNGFLADVQNGWHLWGNQTITNDVSGLNISRLSSVSSMVFWLGGQPDWRIATDGTEIRPGRTGEAIADDNFDTGRPVKGFLGFSTLPTNPFTGGTANRTQPFYDFGAAYVAYGMGNPGGLSVWPTTACDTANNSPIVYLRNNNGTYFFEGTPIAGGVPVVKSCARVYAAIDTRTSTVAANVNGISWMNPRSFQVFTSGMNTTYGQLAQASLGSPSAIIDGNYLQFPAGDNYGDETYDDITNFSGGRTLEDNIPQ